MSCIKPFQSVLYNPEKIHDLSKVICPPYDVISDEQQDQLMESSPNNFIHVLLNKDAEGDTKENNKYTRAKKTFDGWIEAGVLKKDEKPAIYFYKQEYVIQGEKHSRKGFVSLMKLEDEQDSQVYPHENTHSHAVEDRLMLWDTLAANLSCIFVCYSDRQKKVDKIFTRKVAVHDPLYDVTDTEGVRHQLWRLDDEAMITEISATLSGQHLFIADGHHRYQVSNQLRAMREARLKTGDENAPHNYVMTYFTNIDSRDLQIFPMHRIVRTFPEDLSFLNEFFRIDKIRATEDLQILLAKAGRNEHAFGLYTKKGNLLLRLKNKTLINKHVQEGSKDYKSLDATILKTFVFDKIGIESKDIIYTKDFKDAITLVDSGAAQAGFAMNPVTIPQLKAIALNGERMPPKTTYFYPKVISGLTMYKMD